jgi:leucyl aminopeptidase
VLECFLPEDRDAGGGAPQALALLCISEMQFTAWRDVQPESTRAFVERSGFAPERGRVLLVPDAAGRPACVLAGAGSGLKDALATFWFAAGLADRLPAGDYRLADPLPTAQEFALGWAYGSYRFLQYRPQASASRAARLLLPAGIDRAYVEAATLATSLARNLVNTPPNDLGPAELADQALKLAVAHGGQGLVVEGAALHAQFPLVAAVGRGSPRAPRMIELTFPRPGAPRVVLVGKGVCFDSGGLDIKTAAGMLLMKKDMGGAAMALATTLLLRRLEVPVDLRVLIPAVENSVDGESFRPGDVWPSRKGMTVEITNTDAEGRLILADALAAAGENNPDLVIDFATLTGAARIALGAELPAAYGGDAALIAQLAGQGAALADPLWPMPLWDGYEDELTSRIADLNNCPSGGLGGSITAALFLRRFVADPARWIHLDLYCWNGRERPGRPVGAEAQCVRAVAGLLLQRYR